MKILPYNMNMKICRVCRETSEPMANIFESIPDNRMSIADMISQCTGFLVSRSDFFSKTICSPCKQDATNAYEIKQLYENSHRLFCQTEKDSKEGQNLLKQEICEISDYDETGTRQAHNEEEFGQDEFHAQVKNEPIEEDIIEEDLHISDCEVGQFDFEVKNEEFNNAQRDDQRYEVTFDHEDKTEHPIGFIQHPHKCSYCQKSFSNKSNLHKHIQIHTGERPYKCSHCQKSFSNKTNLQRHIFTHTGERPYKCSYCQKSYSDKPNLLIHIRTHTGERPYKCSHCPKSFSQKAKLQGHILTHTGERPYMCSHCQKSFSDKTNLQKHIRIHTGERPYKCSHCQKSFSLKQSLKQHIRTHSGERP